MPPPAVHPLVRIAGVAAVILALGAPPTVGRSWAAGMSKAEKKALKKAKRRAKKFEANGRQAYDEELWDDAIASFELAHQALPAPKYLFNIARCHENRGDLVTALESLDRFIADEPDEEQKELGRDTRAVIDKKLRAAYGELVVRSEPEGAAVRLEKEGVVHSGAAPYRRWVKSGQWTVTVTKEGYEEAKEELAVVAGKPAELKLTLVDPKAEAERKASEEAARREAEEKQRREEEEAARLVEAERLTGEAEARDRRNLYVLAGGGALLAAGGVFGMLASLKNSEIDDLKSDGGFASQYEEAQDAASFRAMTANVLLGLGAATAVTAGALLLLAEDPPEDETVVSAGPLAAGGGLVVSGRF